MLLGKRFARFKRFLNAKINLYYEAKDGKRINLPRKLKMLHIMHFFRVERIKRSALERHKMSL